MGVTPENGQSQLINFDIKPPEPKPLSEEALKALAEFEHVYQDWSFSQRHPELGKMINCPVCDTRHREPRCVQQFVVGPVPPKPRHGMGANKRMNPHFSKRRLQVVQLTRDLIPYFEVAGKELFRVVGKSKRKALEYLESVWQERQNTIRQMQHESRVINRGR